MTKINRLTSRTVAAKTDPGMYLDGLGLYLKVGKGKRWVFIYQWRGKRREMGLGPASGDTLAQARRDARDARELVRSGVDPIAARVASRAGVSFREVTSSFIASKGAGWRNAKHRQQWSNTTHTYADILMSLPVADITATDILAVLRPIWLTKPETARRLRGRIENVLDAAKAQGFRTGENPAVWKGNLAHLLPSQSNSLRGHHRALAFSDGPAFFANLRARDGVAAKALEFTLLNAVRTSETLQSTWSEIDLSARIWNIPAARTKTSTPLRVPLSDASIEVLGRVRGLHPRWLFPNQSNIGPLSTGAMDAVLRRMNFKSKTTVHGLRSTFRDWAGEVTDFPREVVEMALGHKVGSDVERAYRRGDALERRRAVMAAWADYLSPSDDKAANSIRN